MEFATKRRSARGRGGGSVAEAEAEFAARYPHGLSLYAEPPLSDVTLRDFERLAVERVQVLRALLAASATRGLRPHSAEWRNAALDGLRGCDLRDAAKPPRTPIARHRDRVAHFALRLAYCRNEELRRWFLAREVELFRLRFSHLAPNEVDAFLESENLHYETVDERAKSELATELLDSTVGHSRARIDTADFFKVRLSEAADLVRARKVLLRGGRAFVPKDEFVSVLSARFRSELSRALNVASKRLPSIEVDERIASLLKGVHNSYGGREFVGSKDALSPENLDFLSTRAYPLCMRRSHETLRTNHHLKHDGRLQYGLFLKAAGVVYEDAIKFWRDEFTKIMDGDKFEKTYSYNVRYNYGLAGGRKNFSAFSCVKIISGTPSAQESGCPFRCPDASVLKTRLLKYNMNSEDISAIVELAKKGHYQIACSKYFDAVHNVRMDLGINHPNQYFEESRKILEGDVNNAQIKKENGVRPKAENNDDFEDTKMDVEAC